MNVSVTLSVSFLDAHAWAVNLKNHDGTSIFAIFDGHGGAKTATYMSLNILPKFEALENCFDERAVTALCLEIDREYLDFCGDAKELIGTTGILMSDLNSSFSCCRNNFDCAL